MTTNHGLYTDCAWAVPVLFSDPAGDAVDLSGAEYVAEVIANGEVVFTFKSTGGGANDGTINKTLAADGTLTFNASTSQHDGVEAGLYRIHLKKVADTWTAEGTLLIGDPGSNETYLRFDDPGAEAAGAASYAQLAQLYADQSATSKDESATSAVASAQSADDAQQAVLDAEAEVVLAVAARVGAQTAEQGAITLNNSANAAIAVATNFYPGARSYVPQGAALGAATVSGGGSGGTNGTFDLAFSSGNFSVNPTGTFTVSGGAVTAITITGRGLYIGNALSKPTLSFAASSGLTGASGTFNTGYLKTAGEYYLTDHATDTKRVSLFQNQANAAVQITASIDPFSAGVATDAATSFDAMMEYIPSANLYNPANKRTGRYVSTGNGTIAVTAGWNCTEFIPVTPGETIYIVCSATRQGGVSFFTSASDSAYVGSGLSTANGTTTTLTVPAGAAYMVATVNSPSYPEPSQIMINRGSAALPYVAWSAPVPYLKESRIYDDVAAVAIPYVTSYTSPNLYNPATQRDGRLVSSVNGTVSVGSGWACTAFIAVTPGDTIWIASNTSRQPQVSFFSSASDSAVVSGSLNSVDALIKSMTVPAGAAYMVATVKSPTRAEPSQIMINVGSAALPYEAFGTEDRVAKGKVTPTIYDLAENQRSSSLALSTSSAAGATSIVAAQTGQSIVHSISPALDKSRSQSGLFNFLNIALDGVTQFTTAHSDDIAPLHAWAWTIGANHGWPASACTVTGHGKTQVDVGSVWTDGTNQAVIVAVPDANTLWLSRRSGNSYFTTGTFTHVSGATHQTSFSPSAFSNVQWYPAYKNRNLNIFVDDLKIPLADKSYYPRRSVTFAERYTIMDKDSIVEWMVTQAPSVPTGTSSGTSRIEVSNAYTYDMFGGCTIAGEVRAVASVSPFADIMFLQAWQIGAVGGPCKWLIPDTISFVHESTTHDFSKIFDMTGWSKSTYIDFTPARWADANIVPDRLVQFNGQMGFAVGLVPVRDGDPTQRLSLAARKAGSISNLGKFYLAAIDSAARTSLSAGDCFSFLGYRVAFLLNANRTAGYVVRTPEADWVFMDWHQTVRDTFDLPVDLQGRAFSVHRKTAGVTVVSRYGTDALVFDVTTSGGAGQYAILRFDR